jgi:hypothetical protein
MEIVEDFQFTNDKTFKLSYADPFKLLQLLLDSAPVLTELYRTAFALHPPSVRRPWDLLVAWDEFTPGNKLQVDPRRKVMVLSIAFKQLGQAAISSGLGWITPLVIRTTILKDLVGGWPAVLNRFLDRLLLGPEGLCSNSFPLVLNDLPFPLFARPARLLSDGEGLRMGFDWRGHAGLKPCFKHCNVWKKDFG